MKRANVAHVVGIVKRRGDYRRMEGQDFPDPPICGLTNGKPDDTLLPLMTEKELSPLAKLYKRAEELVMDQYRTELDGKGRSQAWKADAVKEDRISNRRSGIVDQFISDVESAVDQLQKESVALPPKEPCKPVVVQPVVAKHPPIPEPPYIPPDTSVHGIDNGWD